MPLVLINQSPSCHLYGKQLAYLHARTHTTTKKSSCPNVFFPTFLQTAVIDKPIPALFVSALQSAAIGGL